MSEIAVLEERRAFFTQKTLAEYLAVSDRTIRDWLRPGDNGEPPKIASYKLEGCRRIDPADVDSFLASRREQGAAT